MLRQSYFLKHAEALNEAEILTSEMVEMLKFKFNQIKFAYLGNST
jgi:hypothetical protein